MEIVYINWLGMFLFVIGIFLIFASGFIIVTNEGRSAKKVRILMGIAGLMILMGFAMLFIYTTKGMDMTTSQTEKVIIKDKIIIQREYSYFTCELTAIDGRTFRTVPIKKKEVVKEVCETYIPGQTYVLEYKDFDHQLYIMREEKK